MRVLLWRARVFQHSALDERGFLPSQASDYRRPTRPHQPSPLRESGDPLLHHIRYRCGFSDLAKRLVGSLSVGLGTKSDASV